MMKTFVIFLLSLLPLTSQAQNADHRGRFFLITGQVTGISDVESLYSVPAALFDLQGRRIVGTPKRGIYASM